MKKIKNTRRVRVPAQQLVSFVRESDQRLAAARHFRDEAARHEAEYRRLVSTTEALKFRAKVAVGVAVVFGLVMLAISVMP